VSILTFKGAGAGKRVVAVEPAYTSQRCSSCGRIVWKGLSVRWHECPYEDCGVRLHRDHNAARNTSWRWARRRRKQKSAGAPSSDANVAESRMRSPSTRGASAPAECQPFSVTLLVTDARR